MNFCCRRSILIASNVFKKLSRTIANEKLMHSEDPVLRFYRENFDFSEDQFKTLSQKYSNVNFHDIENVTEILQELQKFDIDKTEAISAPKIFHQNSSYVRNRGKIFQECGFAKIGPQHIIKNRLLSKFRTLRELKLQRIIPRDRNVVERLHACFDFLSVIGSYNDSEYEMYTLFEIRMMVMQKYFEREFQISKGRFDYLVMTYYQFHNRPFCDIKESVDIALNELKFPISKILSYPYVLCADPVNTRKIIDEVIDFNGIHAYDVLRNRPHVINVNYKKILKIRNILKESGYDIVKQKRALLLYTLNPDTIIERIKELEGNESLNALSTNKRFLLLVLNKERVIKRIKTYMENNKKCPRMCALLYAEPHFQRMIRECGNMSSRRDIAQAITSLASSQDIKLNEKKYTKMIKEYIEILAQHSYCNFVPVTTIVNTINMLLQYFSQKDILQNCHIVLYSCDTIKSLLFSIRNKQQVITNDLSDTSSAQPVCESDESDSTDSDDNNSEIEKLLSNLHRLSIDFTKLSNTQALGLILYLIEKEHSFTGEGVWNNQELQDD